MDRFGPTGKVSKKSVQLSRWTTFPGWTGPIENLTIPTHSQSQYLAVRYFSCTTWRKTLIIAAFGLLTADLSVLLVHPCAVTTGPSVAAWQAKCMF